MAILNGRPARRPRRRRAALSLEFLEGRQLLSTVVVTNDNDSGPGSLRAAVASSPSGSTITFAPSAYGTITLTSGPLTITNEALTIQGPGAGLLSVTTAGKGDAIEITGPDTNRVKVGISGLMFEDCQSAVLNQEALLTVTNCAFRNNVAGSIGPAAIGNEIDGNDPDLNSLPTILTLVGDTFAGNRVEGAEGFVGGAVDTDSPTTVTSCTFSGNVSIGQLGQGGAIVATNGSPLTIRDSTFINNVAQSTSYPGAEGEADGGAIYTFDASPVIATGDTFIDNKAEGPNAEGGVFFSNSGDGVQRGSDGVVYPYTSTFTDCQFIGNVAVADDAASTRQGVASGGALYDDVGVLVVTGSTFTANQAVAEPTTGATGGFASGGAIDTGPVLKTVLISDAFTANRAQGGAGATNGGGASGGAANLDIPGAIDGQHSEAAISGVTFTGNQAVAAPGDSAGGQAGASGGALNLGVFSTTLNMSTFLGNQAVGSAGVDGSAGGGASGGAVASLLTLTVVGGTFEGNTAQGGIGGASASAAGGAGGAAYGGAISNNGTLSVTGAAFTANSAAGGAGGVGTTGGAGGAAYGGGVASNTSDTTTPASLNLTSNTVMYNVASAGIAGIADASGGASGADGVGYGGGVAIVSGTAVLNLNPIGGNSATSANNEVYGTYTH